MIGSFVRLMRPGDWVKNVFVLPALVFSLPTMIQAGDPIVSPVIRTVLAFAAFCLLASGFYAVNDAVDVNDDRRHPVKCRRPVASGVIAVRQAFVFGLILIAAGLTVGFAVNLGLGLTLALYTLLQVSYNLRLKRVLLVDVVAIAIGFALRATAGAAAIEVQISIWMLLCVFFLCLYLGFVKRLCDIASAEAAGSSDWHTAASYDSRIELNWLLGISAVLAIVTYLMYSLSTHALNIFGSRALGFSLLSPLVMITIHRFYRRASKGTSDSPLSALREDRTVLVSVAMFGVGVLATLFVPAVQNVLDHLFIAGGDTPMAAVDSTNSAVTTESASSPAPGGVGSE